MPSLIHHINNYKIFQVPCLVLDIFTIMQKNCLENCKFIYNVYSEMLQIQSKIVAKKISVKPENYQLILLLIGGLFI